jgi:hypothetical protein
MIIRQDLPDAIRQTPQKAKRRSVTRFSFEALHDLLKISNNTEIINIYVDPYREIVSMVLSAERGEDPSGYDVPEGLGFPEINTDLKEKE